MLQNSAARLTIWLGLDDPLDYETMNSQCAASGYEQFTYLEFAHKVGMLYCAKRLYPDLPVAEAYSLFVNKFGATHSLANTQQQPTATQAAVAPTTCCGGGKVL